jgi:thiol-disulfide isomerase/thioredoxin
MQKDSKIYLIGGLILAVVIVGAVIYLAKNDNSPGQLDTFATALKDKGVIFYGAFWCPHCQATKALFGKSAKLLPYVECSTPDGNNQTQVCIDNKIEEYPTWAFKDGIKITSNNQPTICPIKTKDVIPAGVCEKTSSEYYRVWIFSENGFSIRSSVDPVKNGDTWQFPYGAQAVGEVPLSFLAEQIQFTLPQ